MRHEVINLARASTGQAEAYPSCFQLQVTGGSSVSPTDFVKSLGSDDVARFPGGYKASDAGLNFDPYTAGKDYPFPGPNISKAISNGGNGGGGETTPSTPTRSVPTSTVRTGTSTTSTTSPQTPGNPGSTPTRSPPRVITTTVTQVFVLTMTMPNDSPKNKNLAVTTTTTLSSQLPTTTPADDPKDGCHDDEETSTRPSTTTSSLVAKSTGYARRHARRSERWRAATMESWGNYEE